MPKQQSDREVNEARPDGQAELVVPVAEAVEPAQAEFVTVIHPRTKRELPATPAVASMLAEWGWSEKK